VSRRVGRIGWPCFRVIAQNKRRTGDREGPASGGEDLQDRKEGHASMDMSLYDGTIWQCMTPNRLDSWLSQDTNKLLQNEEEG
jgi:hypothetical protein